MRITINKRDNHDSLYRGENNTLVTYKEYFDKAVKEAKHLSVLLNTIECEIQVTPDNCSWCGQEVTVEYKGYTFNVHEDYHKKIFAHAYSENKYRQIVKEDYEGKHLPNYTFYKLTTKKLLSLLDERVKEYEWLHSKANETENTNKIEFDKACADMKRIADAIGDTVKVSETDRHTTHSLMTPTGWYNVSYDSYNKSVSDDYNMRKLIEFMDMLK